MSGLQICTLGQSKTISYVRILSLYQEGKVSISKIYSKMHIIIDALDFDLCSMRTNQCVQIKMYIKIVSVFKTNK